MSTTLLCYRSPGALLRAEGRGSRWVEMALESRRTCRVECGAPGRWVPQQPCQQGPPTSLGYPGGQSSRLEPQEQEGSQGSRKPAQPKPGSPGNKYYTLRVLPEESLLQTRESRDNLRSVWHLQSRLREGSKGPALPGVCLWAACLPAGDTSDSGGQIQRCSRNLGGGNNAVTTQVPMATVCSRR